MNNEYTKLDDFLIYAICFMLGAITFLIFPRDYSAPMGPIASPTKTILDQTTVNGVTCSTYNSNINPNAEATCYKAQ